MVSGILSFAVGGSAVGILWIFVLGDNPWPLFVEEALPVLLVSVFLLLWLAIAASGFFIGKKLEQNPRMNKSHILAAVCATLLPVLLMVVQQLSVGNIGPKSEGQRCSAYCSKNGYSASSTPPQNSGERTCSCLDPFGKEIITIPMERIDIK
jgi:hypothetical protein